MRMRSKNFSGDQTLQHSGTAEMSKPPSVRRQQPEKQSETLNCPRCSSTNTKFCYYNNYNKSQPRHFCKSCKRHWTKGGTLRNVPVGGGRKNKRPKISRAAGVTATVPATASALRQQDLSTASTLLHETSEGVDNVTITGKPFVGDGDWASLDTTAFQIIPNKEFQLSSLSTFDKDGSLNPASCNQPSDNFAGNLDSVEESAITAVNIPGRGDAAWAGLESSSTLELPNYWNWNWNDVDVLISSDVSIPWDDQDQDNAVTKR